MREKVLGLLMLLVLFLFAPFHLSNTYLQCSEFSQITVKSDESVWSIAERYTANEEQTRSLQEAIIEINNLNAGGKVLAGQTLRIPIKER